LNCENHNTETCINEDHRKKTSERLAESGIDPSEGSVGNSYDNTLVESTIGLFKPEVINFMGPWKTVSQVEWETLK
jgi:putative transposase